jgi:hypothetical protein
MEKTFREDAVLRSKHYARLWHFDGYYHNESCSSTPDDELMIACQNDEIFLDCIKEPLGMIEESYTSSDEKIRSMDARIQTYTV